MCGDYDNDEFNSDDCCGCSGGGSAVPVIDERELGTCSNEPYPTDLGGDGCNKYNLYP